MRWANRVDNCQKLLVEILRKRGFEVHIIGQPFDLLIAKAGKMSLAEVKDPKKKGHANEFTPKQRAFMENWTGPPIPILRTEEDALTFEITS